MGLIESDVHLNKNAVIKLIVFGFVGGWVSGALGLGGGVIFNPVLLSLGVPPQVASATSMYLIFFSTMSSSFIYIIYGMLNIKYACWIGFWSVLGTFQGLSILERIIKKYNRQSLIVFVLTGILAISAMLVPIFGGLELKSQSESGTNIY